MSMIRERHQSFREGIVQDQYIVTFRPRVRRHRELTQRLAESLGFEVSHTYEHAIQGFSAKFPARVASILARNPRVARVESDVRAHVTAQTLPTGVDRIDTDRNATAQIDGTDTRIDVDIAIIDTGIDLDHPDLHVVFDRSFRSSSFFSRDRNGDDNNGHGSHVAGSAAAMDNTRGVVGVAPGARLWALKALDENGSGFFSDVIAAIDFVTANAAEIEVVNLSLGGQGSLNALRTAIQNSVAAGVVYVASAGNGSQDIYGADGIFNTSDDFIPAAYPEVIATSAMADSDGQPGGTGPQFSSGAPDDTVASFSNFSRNVTSANPVTSSGAAIDMAAPGVGILSTWNDGGLARLSGTSTAAPHVAGAVALYIAKHGRASTASLVHQIRQALINDASPQSQWGPSDTRDPDGNLERLVFVGETSAENSPPAVEITQPSNGAEFSAGASITFEGMADDAEDGDLSAEIRWVSNLDDSIGEGASLTTSTLSEGDHLITASVSDSQNLEAEDTVSITILAPSNNPPTAEIIQPDDGSQFSPQDSIEFRGEADDIEDGDLSDDLEWRSNLDGSIGSGAVVNSTLNVGSHTITASVHDSQGAQGSETITVTVQEGDANTSPTVTILEPSNFDIIRGSTVTLQGTASDPEDGDISSQIRWTSSDDGSLGTGSTVTVQLSRGSHTITANVTDSNGSSTSNSIRIWVLGR